MTSRTAAAVISASLSLSLLFISAGNVWAQAGPMEHPATKGAAPKPPSWRGQFQGQQLLSLPANYDKWFYVGKGPMTLKLIRPYSQIQIGGTNDSRNPFGDATLPDDQKTDLKALVPDAPLGAIVLKIGKDSKPFQAFSERMDPTKTGLQIRSTHEIYLAINDSYYPDNRGTHTVVIEGGELNLRSEEILPAPKLLTPDEGAVMSHYPRKTTLNWEPVIGAVAYTVEIQYPGPIDSGVAEWNDLTEFFSHFPGANYVPPVRISTTSFSFNWIGANLGRWRVWAIDSSGKEGIKSQWRRFRFSI
jgi:hypothetical protein